MAAGGITFVGTTGEDYAVPFSTHRADTTIRRDQHRLTSWRAPERRTHADAMETAESFSWKNVVEDNLIGKLRYVALRQLVTPPGTSEVTPPAETAPPGTSAAQVPEGAPAAPGELHELPPAKPGHEAARAPRRPGRGATG
jgi:hypothetical protein